VRDDPYVVALVARAAQCDEGAWQEIVDRYASLVWSICVGYRLSTEDSKDVFGEVSLSLVKQLGKMRAAGGCSPCLPLTRRRPTRR
jgi:hypothetical protein